MSRRSVTLQSLEETGHSGKTEKLRPGGPAGQGPHGGSPDWQQSSWGAALYKQEEEKGGEGKTNKKKELSSVLGANIEDRASGPDSGQSTVPSSFLAPCAELVVHSGSR